MKSEKERLKLLLNKYLQGDITREELVQLDHCLRRVPHAQQEQIFSQIWESSAGKEIPDLLFSEHEKTDLLNRIFQLEREVEPVSEGRYRRLYNWKAAVLVAACSIAAIVGFFWLRPANEVEKALSLAVAEYPVLQGVDAEEVSPAGHEAVFMTNGGEKITLKDNFVGVIDRGEGFQIVRTSSGEVQYQSVGDKLTDKWHTVATPNGGQVNFLLPDGTKVWLNAASSIRFRSDMGVAGREVEMLGEVYFEVAKRKEKKFVVKSDFGNIEVLGTKFNVNTYDRRKVQTALLEGSIQLNTAAGSRKMRPNELTTISKTGKMQTDEKDNIQNMIAWTSGYFYFEDADISTVGQHLARWYNIGVEVSNSSMDRKITGTIDRNVKLSKMIEMLEYLGLNCVLNNGKLIININ